MRPSTLPLVDRLLDGQLESLLRTWRTEEALSFAEVVRRFQDDHQLTLSIETVRRWCDQLGIEKSSGTTAGAA